MDLHERFSDRLRAAREDLAWSGLKGDLGTAHLVPGFVRQVTKPLAPLWDGPHLDASQSSTLVFGRLFRVLETDSMRCWGQVLDDGYVGWIDRGSLGKPIPTDHEVIMRAVVLRRKPQLKSPPRDHLPLGAKVQVLGWTDNGFAQTPNGFVPASALRKSYEAIDASLILHVGESMLGTPYVWGGGGYDGIDCSGLVQALYRLVEPGVLRDADMQEQTLGTPCEGAHLPGDLLFWPGHVAIMWTHGRVLHASGHHMHVLLEPWTQAAARLEKQVGSVRTRRRHPIMAALMSSFV